eukprot:Amastigsp_a347564_14.p1 type:complete len:117 gc:universal Amastigsp_a347564_14:195-545(+)
MAGWFAQDPDFVLESTLVLVVFLFAISLTLGYTVFAAIRHRRRMADQSPAALMARSGSGRHSMAFMPRTNWHASRTAMRLSITSEPPQPEEGPRQHRSEEVQSGARNRISPAMSTS